MKPKVLIVDDEAALRYTLRAILEETQDSPEAATVINKPEFGSPVVCNVEGGPSIPFDIVKIQARNAVLRNGQFSTAFAHGAGKNQDRFIFITYCKSGAYVAGLADQDQVR